jgi:formylglycine-generating enzyme required for sulfatase activity
MPAKHRGGLDIDQPESNLDRGINYLLAIAVNAYQHTPKLSNCVKDAEAVVNILTSRYDFESQNVVTLFDEDATKGNIDRNLRQLAQKVTEKDNLLIYFAGHGVYDKNGGTGGYIVPVEAEAGQFWQYISNGDFLNLIRAIKSFHTFLLMDSCFSGTLFRNVGDSSIRLAENVERFPSRWGLAAGMIEEVEDGWHEENSPFAQAVIQFLKTNTNSKFPASELVQYTKRVTPRNAKQTPIGGPLFKVGDLDGEFVFHLKKDEVADWETALKTGTVAAFQSFLVSHPEGVHAQEAQAELSKLSAADLWASIKTAPDDNIFQISQKTLLIDEYIEQYQGTEKYRQVLEEGKKMECKKKLLEAGTSKYALLDFIAENPPYFKQEAQKVLDEIQQKGTSDKDNQEIDTQKRAREEELRKAREAKKREEAARLKAEKEKLLKQQQEKTKARKQEPSFFNQYGKWIGIALAVLIVGFIGIKFIGSGKKTLQTLPAKDKEGEFGYKRGDKWLIEPQYTMAEKFSGDRAKVTRGDETFIINLDGYCVAECPPMYRYAEKGSYGVKRKDGQELTKAIYDDVGFYNDGLIAILKDDKWGYLNDSGKEVIAFEFDEVDISGGFEKGYVGVRVGEKHFFIDRNGDRVNADDLEEGKTDNAFLYQMSMRDGDTYFSKGDYEKALQSYKDARSNKDTEQVRQKIRDCQEKLGIPLFEKANTSLKESSIIKKLEKNMVKIPGGTFTMGCTQEQGNDCRDNEKPAHKVKLSTFFINKYEVTQEEWEQVMGENPSKFSGCKKCPVEQVSWNDAQEFIKKLNKITSKKYRLPTEAEWEYAARGGNEGFKYAGGNSIEQVAWYSGNADNKTHPVGGKKANGFGLYDMSGNVWEFCNDRYGDYESGLQENPKGPKQGSDRVDRGGSWLSDAQRCRVAYRDGWYPGIRLNYLGFRLALSLQ